MAAPKVVTGIKGGPLALESYLPHSIDQALEMVRFAAAGVDLTRVWVTVGYNHTREGRMWRPPQAYRKAGKAGAEAHVQVLVPWPDQWAWRGHVDGEDRHLTAEQNAACGWGPEVRLTTPEEDLVSTLAHELRHLVQNREDEAAGWTLWPQEIERELDAMRASRACLDRWRARR